MAVENMFLGSDDISRMADETLLAIVSYGTPDAKTIDQRLSNAIHHYLIRSMTEVRNRTLMAQSAEIDGLLQNLRHATSL